MHVNKINCMSNDWVVFLIETCSDQNNTATALSYHIHTNSYSRTPTMDALAITVWDDVISWHIDSTPTTVWMWFNSWKMFHDVASACYKMSALAAQTFWQLHKLHWQISNSTSAGVTRMQVAKVVIASVLILTVCARLPEGKDCVLKYVSDVKFPQMSSATLKCSMVN